jgi:peptidoglycan hydrolase CwlO-like protein
MESKKIEELVTLRNSLIKHFKNLKDYKSNKNALIKEIDHAELVHSTIVQLDLILKDYVEFS